MKKAWTLLMCLVVVGLIGLHPLDSALGQAGEETAAVQSEEPAAEAQPDSPAQIGTAEVLAQPQVVILALQREVRTKRLTVLKRLESGEINASQAYEELEQLPAPASQFQKAAGSNVFLTLNVKQGENNDVMVALPIPIVRWLISEGPKLLPAELRNELDTALGYPIAEVDLSVFAQFLDSLSYTTQSMVLFHVQNGEDEIMVMVTPMAPSAQ